MELNRNELIGSLTGADCELIGNLFGISWELQELDRSSSGAFLDLIDY